MIASKVIRKISDYGTLVMFSHSIFSLSFAVISMLLASNGFPSAWKVFWILMAFMGARTGANAINRAIDAEIDMLNPRTSTRQIPQGKISKNEAYGLAAASFGIMLLSAAMLNILCLILSPLALIFMTGYSYTKRFTWLCHIILGVTTAAAPVGAWIAVTGNLSVTPLIMGVSNTLWVAGFDIIYSIQDYEFDKANKLRSIPVKFGIHKALHISSIFHIISCIFLLVLGLICKQLGIIYFSGLLIITVLFAIEHLLVANVRKPDDTRGEVYSFTAYSLNQIISIVFLTASLLEMLV
ncbi:UbiA-like polyprenyltransferase [Ruminiclostridium josui]|uniref:UbiA-like polyprenyltransferase n=1 Tax=Ruminiclostridium josui TaxID=1499 RepID=UPI000466C6CA|nr:UbiA-like polyprenyltransferase [Ruminiclostridium josui]